MRFLVLVAAAFGLLAGCTITLDCRVDKQAESPPAEGMTRAEIVNAILDCEDMNGWPVLVYDDRVIHGKLMEIVVDVECASTKKPTTL